MLFAMNQMSVVKVQEFMDVKRTSTSPNGFVIEVNMLLKDMMSFSIGTQSDGACSAVEN